MKLVILRRKLKNDLLEQSYPDLPESIREKMVAFAGEVRKLFMGADENPDKLTDRLEVTFSTRTLLRWADLTSALSTVDEPGRQAD